MEIITFLEIILATLLVIFIYRLGIIEGTKLANQERISIKFPKPKPKKTKEELDKEELDKQIEEYDGGNNV